MIITKTPFRISFFGGGTDYPDWYLQHGGAVLATSIDKYCYVSCRHLPPFFEHRHRIVYSRIENVQSANDIVHPAVRGVFNWLGVESGLEVHHDGERFASILHKAILELGEPGDDFEKKSLIAEWVTNYHVDNGVSGVVLCEECHDEEHD